MAVAFDAEAGDDPVVVGEDFVVFYRREYGPVVRLAFALTGRWELAEEFAQDAFLAAERRWEKVGRYDSPAGWVRRVVTNRCVSGFHKARHEVEALLRLSRTPLVAVDLPELDRELWAAVRALPARQAQVLALVFVEDRSPAEVAAVLGVSEETVRTHLRRGRLGLARRLGLSVREES